MCVLVCVRQRERERARESERGEGGLLLVSVFVNGETLNIADSISKAPLSPTKLFVFSQVFLFIPCFWVLSLHCTFMLFYLNHQLSRTLKDRGNANTACHSKINDRWLL